MNKAVFFDRDGTINSDEGLYYIYRKEDFRFNPGVIEAMQLLQKAGYLLFIITNQGGVAKGLYTETDIQAVHDYMCAALEKEGIRISKIYYCPHHESVSTCNCRKPSPYMIKQAIQEFDIDKSQSFMIGDSSRDVQAGEAAGIRAIKTIKNSNLLPYVLPLIPQGAKI